VWCGRPLALLTLVACVGSCADQAPTEGVVEQRAAIVGGELSGAEQDGVVLLRGLLDDGSELVCTASLVGPNLVLTARHCVSYLSEGQFSCSVRGEVTDNPDGGGQLGLHLPAERLEIYGGKTPRKTPLARGLQVISTLSPTICKNDVAFVVLDRQVDLPIVPMRLGRPAQVHEASVLVGYGLDATQTGIDYLTQPRRQKRELEIAAVGPDSLADGVTTVPPRALILNGPSGCIGDSGGPLLAASTGAVLGVYSLQDGNSCTDPKLRHQMVHVPPFGTLIDEAFSAAGCLPTPEPDAASAGAGGDGSLTGAAAAGSSAGGDASSAGDAGGDRSSAGAGAEAEAGPHPASSLESSCALGLRPGSVRAGLALLVTLAGVLRLRRGRQRRRLA